MIYGTAVIRKSNIHYIYTRYAQKNGAISKVNKKFISHLTRAQPTHIHTYIHIYMYGLTILKSQTWFYLLCHWQLNSGCAVCRNSGFLSSCLKTEKLRFFFSFAAELLKSFEMLHGVDWSKQAQCMNKSISGSEWTSNCFPAGLR